MPASSLARHVLNSNTQLGALRFDKDVRAVVSHLSTLASSGSFSSGGGIRDRFIRLVQICTVLNLENSAEVYEVWNSSSGIKWRLTGAEVKKIMGLRADFTTEEIKKLKLS